MKKIILALLLVASGLIASAQKEPLATPFAVPIDSISKLITYEKVVEVKNVSEKELYNRINEWFKTFYKNPSEVIRENDSVKHVIVGKPRFRLSNLSVKDETKTEAGLVQYTITVASREGRFKYEITAFNVKQASYFPCERWLDTKSASYQPVYNDYLQQLDKYTIDLINSLMNAANHAKPVRDKDKW
jgi:hypothetical protein